MANAVWYRQPGQFGQPARWVRIANITAGPRGATGKEGPPGHQGAPGPAGPTGVTGTSSAWTVGSGAPVTSGITVGDMYLDTASGNVYIWNGSSWAFSTNITGQTGSAGVAGVAGTGLPGPPGPRGATWLIGNNAPTLFQGNLGDLYFQTTKTGGGAIILKGDQGPQGQQGPAGQPGPQGQLGQSFTQVHMSSQNISNNTVTAVQFATVDFDTVGAFSAGNNTRLTAQSAGYYLIGAWTHWPVTAHQTTTRVLDFKVNNTTFYPQQSGIPGEAAVNDMRQSATALLHLAANDFVEVTVYQDDGGTIAVGACYFWMVKIG